MRTLSDFFEPRKRKEFFEILANYEAKGYTIAVEYIFCRQLYIFKQQKIIIMRIKGTRLKPLDWDGETEKKYVAVVTHIDGSDPDDKELDTKFMKKYPPDLYLAYPLKMKKEYVDVDESEARLFKEFIQGYVALPAINKTELLRRIKLKEIELKLGKG